MPGRGFISIVIYGIFAWSFAGAVEANERLAVSCDLNGDGVKEDVRCSMEAKNPNWPHEYNDFTISVNGLSVSYLAEALTGDFQVVDIDSTDNYMELAVSEYGPSDDPASHFFRFVGGELVALGKVPGSHLVVDGSGKIQAHCRGQLLHTWFYACKYCVGPSHKLELLREAFYPMNASLVAKERLFLLAEPGGQEVSAAVFSGARITVLGSDDLRWCLVETEDKVRGWFELTDFGTLADGRSVYSVFDGLWIAD